MRVLMIALLHSALAAACASPEASTALDRLHPCRSEEGPTDAYCGTHRVYENRATREGRTIDLKIVVLPALGAEPKPDPLFFLAGGPGQGAAELARPLRGLFRGVQRERDIVLVDQRGTGRSHPLNCEWEDESLRQLEETAEHATARLRECLAGLQADVRQYTTTVAMDDLDEIRAFLGYERINLYGGSYGTRAALVYLRQHGDTVRSVVLDGVAPMDMRLPLFFARDAQRALDLLLNDCAADPACAAKYPRLADRLRLLMTSLDATPVRTRLTHPRTGETEEVTVSGETMANVIFGALYAPLSSTLLPELIARGERGDFQALFALAFANEGAAENMSLGMQLSVICAEDFPRLTPEQLSEASANTVFARHLMRTQLQACEFWPKGAVDPSYYQPVTSSVPTLILSGELDPVTPPAWGESVLPQLTRARHHVVPGTGHGALSTGCGLRLIEEFLTDGSAEELDVSCLRGMKRPPFFLTPAGPDPRAGNATGSGPSTVRAPQAAREPGHGTTTAGRGPA